MPLHAGDRLGPYEILAPIGAGGMGEVYKARDTRLDRIVAIKISAEQFSERFEQEARAVAALNHPHICTLHDVGPNYLVMEYVEGTPLKGPLPAGKAVDYGNQILDALDAAHQKGITHRDLKPGNILVTKQGIKLLDFGLAKRATPLAESDATQALTSQGQIAGTLQYMSPEQLQGKEIDTRSDLFAFGCVLYELLTGKRAFHGQNAASVVAAILEREPAPLTAAPPLDRVVRRSLAKDPDQRFQTARDLKAALAWAMEQPPPSAATKSGRLWWIGGLAAVCLGVLLLLLFSRSGARPDAELMRFAIYPPEGTKFSAPLNATIGAPQFALSPDGRAMVFVASATGTKPLLWVRSLNEVTSRPVAGTERASYPFWSPDSRWLGFFAEGKLKKILAAGGPAQVVSEGISTTRGGAWGPDDTILFAYNFGRINRVPAEGGPIAPVTMLDTSLPAGTHGWPQFLPDGRHFLYHQRGAAEHRGVYAGSLDGKPGKFLVHSDWSAAYAAPGYLLYLDGDSLAARPFDAGRLEVGGAPSTIAEHVGGATSSFAAVSLSRTGVLAYASTMLHIGRLVWFDRTGKMLEAVGPEGDYTDFRLSPDEKRLAVSVLDSRASTPGIWLTDLMRGSKTRLTFDPSFEASPVWSPDGTRIVFRTLRGGIAEIYQTSTAGGGREEPVFLLDAQRAAHPGGSVVPTPTDWSPDGRYVIYSIPTAASGYDLWLLPVPGSSPGDKKPMEFTHSPGDELDGQFSPDGRFVAYSSNESGKFEVYVQTFPRSDRRWAVSTSGGYEPRWRRDGRELYYLSEDRKLMVVPVGASPVFEAGTPKALFQTRVPEGVSPFRTNYVPSHDGQRFLVNTQNAETAPPSITVVLNWTAGLKK